VGKELKAGVIGAGIMGASHAREFSANQYTELVGVADLDETKADEIAKKEGEDYKETEALLKKIEKLKNAR